MFGKTLKKKSASFCSWFFFFGSYFKHVWQPFADINVNFRSKNKFCSFMAVFLFVFGIQLMSLPVKTEERKSTSGRQQFREALAWFKTHFYYWPWTTNAYSPNNLNCTPQIENKEDNWLSVHFFHTTKNDEEDKIPSNHLEEHSCYRESTRHSTFWNSNWNIHNTPV